MTHPKTIEAYKNAGLGWTSLNETAQDVALAAKKQLIDDKQPLIEITSSVYRLRVESEPPSTDISEYILFDKHTIGKSGIGNKVEWWEGPDNLCYWFEPITQTITCFNVETERMETRADSEDIKLKTHYLYPFNKENIKMIAEMTKNNRHVNWMVKDNTTSFTRDCKSFQEWRDGDFDTLICSSMSKDLLEKQQAKQLGTAQQQQYH